MTEPPSRSPGRVVVVGGGAVGTMHALEGWRRGWDVVHLEADLAPRRASVRNFGLLWVSGRAPGAELDLALRARARWEELARWAGYAGFRANGSLTVATTEAEWSVLEELAAQPEAGRRGVELLDEPAARRTNPALRGAMVGALWCHRDAVVEPGDVLAALRRLPSAEARYRWVPGRTAVEVRPGSVTDHTGVVHPAELVIVCPGDRLAGIGGAVGEVLAAAPLRRCRLLMLQTEPAAERLTTSVADADSLRYYPAFDLPARRRLPPPAPEPARWKMQLLLVQRADGALTIGDTHVYEEPFDFAVEEVACRELLARARALLGWRPPAVARRWAGVYTLVTDDRPCYRQLAASGIVVVTGPAGRGMTLAPAIAEDTWREIEA